MSGTVRGSNGNPLPGANVVVTGSTIGTIADINGYFSIAIPSKASSLNFSFIGYASQEIPIRSGIVNVILQEDLVSLNEVVVAGYAADYESEPSSSVRRAPSTKSSQAKTLTGSSLAIPTIQLENQTSVEFSIDMPYSVKSDSKNHVVELTTYEVPAFYEYYCVPRTDSIRSCWI